MRNLAEMTLSEIKNLVFELYSDKKAREILSLPMDEVISILEEDEACVASEGALETQKHRPSRKKKANRTRKPTTSYKKVKNAKWKEQRRTKLPEEETTSRAYLNKASKAYTKLQPHVKPTKK